MLFTKSGKKQILPRGVGFFAAHLSRSVGRLRPDATERPAGVALKVLIARRHVQHEVGRLRPQVSGVGRRRYRRPIPVRVALGALHLRTRSAACAVTPCPARPRGLRTYVLGGVAESFERVSMHPLAAAITLMQATAPDARDMHDRPEAGRLSLLR